MRLDVLVPIVIVGILIIVGLILCYCYFRKGSYDFIEVDLEQPELAEQSGERNVKPSFKIPIGLRNIDNNCYMNSVMQALASSDIIIEQFKSAERLIPYSGTLRTLLKLIEGINNETKSATINNNTQLLTSLIKYISWNKKSQQDVLDLMSSIVNAIHAELKQAAPEIPPPLKFELLHRTIGCDMNDTLQYHIALTLGLCGSYEKQPGVDLTYLIDEYLSPTSIDGDSMKISQTFFYQKTPEVLVLQISANKLNPHTRTMYKPVYYIQYDKCMKLNLPIGFELDKGEISMEQVKYKLQAVIHHTGSYSSGHYVTFRNFKGTWILSNDEKVEITTFDNSICPYVLIYEKVSKNSSISN